jgi:hypothetical protein
MISTVYEISIALGISMPDLIEQTIQEYESHYKISHNQNESIPKRTS